MTIHGGGGGLGGLRGGALGRALSIGLGAPIGLLGLEQASTRILATRMPFDDVLDSTVMTELARVSASAGRTGTGLQLQVVDLLIQRVEVVSKLPLGDRNSISGDFLAASRSPMLVHGMKLGISNGKNLLPGVGRSIGFKFQDKIQHVGIEPFNLTPDESIGDNERHVGGRRPTLQNLLDLFGDE